MIINFDLLYKNGKSEIIVQEASEEVLTEIANTFYASFLEGKDAVIKFVSGDETTLVRTDDVSRVKFTIVEGGE